MSDGKNSLKSAIWGLKTKSYELGTTGHETPKKGVRGENGATNIRSFFTGIPCHYVHIWMVIQLDCSPEIYGQSVNYDSAFNNAIISQKWERQRNWKGMEKSKHLEKEGDRGKRGRNQRETVRYPYMVAGGNKGRGREIDRTGRKRK